MSNFSGFLTGLVLVLASCTAPVLTFGPDSSLPLQISVPGDSSGTVQQALPAGSRAVPPGATSLRVEATGGPLGTEVRTFNFSVTPGINTFEVPGLPYGILQVTLTLYQGSTALTTGTTSVDFQPGISPVGVTMRPASVSGGLPASVAENVTVFCNYNLTASTAYRVLTLDKPLAQWLDVYNPDGSPYAGVYCRGQDFVVLSPVTNNTTVVVGVKAERGFPLTGRNLTILPAIFVDPVNGNDNMGTGLTWQSPKQSFASALFIAPSPSAILASHGTSPDTNGINISKPGFLIGGFNSNFSVHSPGSFVTNIPFSGTGGTQVLGSGQSPLVIRDLSVSPSSSPITRGINYTGTDLTLLNVKINPFTGSKAALVSGITSSGSLVVKDSYIEAGRISGGQAVGIHITSVTANLEVYNSTISGGQLTIDGNTPRVDLYGIYFQSPGTNQKIFINSSRVWGGSVAGAKRGFTNGLNFAAGLRVGDRLEGAKGTLYLVTILNSQIGGGLFATDPSDTSSVEYNALKLFQNPRGLIWGSTLDAGYALNTVSTDRWVYPLIMNYPVDLELINNLWFVTQGSHTIYVPYQSISTLKPLELQYNVFDGRATNQYTYEDRLYYNTHGYAVNATLPSDVDYPNYLGNLSGIVSGYKIDSTSFANNYLGNLFQNIPLQSYYYSLYQMNLDASRNGLDQAFLSYDLEKKPRTRWSAGAFD